MGVRLVIGKLQRKLIHKFTIVEVLTLTLWLYLALFGLVLVMSSRIEYQITGVVLTILSVIVLALGLEKEHEIATESGNAGANA